MLCAVIEEHELETWVRVLAGRWLLRQDIRRGK